MPLNPSTPTGPVSEAHDVQTLPVIQEQLEVTRRQRESGHALRVRRHVSQEHVEVDEPVVNERVDAVRVPIGRVIAEPAVVRQEGDVMIVPVVEERLVLRKELVLVEEVRITRRIETQAVRERHTVRREHVVIERFDPDSGQWHAESGESPGGTAGAGPPGGT